MSILLPRSSCTCCAVVGLGLPEEFAAMGQAVRIESNDSVDSLNLAVAAAIGIYEFTK